MSQKISEERKAAYYIGMGLMVLGIILFASVFVTGAMNFGDFSNFEADAKSSMARALIGMALMVVGGVIRGSVPEALQVQVLFWTRNKQGMNSNLTAGWQAE
jgi:cytosine/uracil/thiamine/allantoin permease